MKKYALQIKENDCGFALFKSLCATYYKNSSFLYMINQKSAEYNMLELQNLFASYGIKSVGYQLESKYLNKYQNCIVILKINQKYHYCILNKYRPKKVLIFDPSYGPVSLTKEYFNAIFSGKCLVILKPSLKNKKKMAKKRFPTIIFVLSFIEHLLLLLFILTIESYELGFISIIVIALYALEMILRSSLLVKKMKQIDKRYINPNLLESKAEYINYTKKKEEYLRIPFQIFSKIFLTLIIGFLIALKNKIGVFELCAVLLLSFIEIVFRTTIKNKRYLLEIEENEIFNQKSSEVVLSYNQRCYRLGVIINQLNIGKLFILFVITSIFHFLLHDFSFGGLFYSFALNYLFLQNGQIIWTCSDFLRKHDQAYNYLKSLDR